MNLLLLGFPFFLGLTSAQDSFTLPLQNEFFRPYYARPGKGLMQDYVDLDIPTTSECECRKHCMIRSNCLSFSMDIDASKCLMSFTTRGAPATLEDKTRHLHFARNLKADRFDTTSKLRVRKTYTIPGGLMPTTRVTLAATNKDGGFAKTSIFFGNGDIDYWFSVIVVGLDQIIIQELSQNTIQSDFTIPVSPDLMAVDVQYLLQVEVTTSAYEAYLNGELLKSVPFSIEVQKAKNVILMVEPKTGSTEVNAFIVES